MSYNRQTTLNCENNPDADCAVEAALSIIGGKWKLKIYKSLRSGEPIRFSNIHKALKDISEKTLSSQLQELEQDGIISRTAYPTLPPKVEYQLTELGFALESIFISLNKWGKDYINNKSVKA
jgi:DNA-binding HxlR family transcriptional regulator